MSRRERRGRRRGPQVVIGVSAVLAAGAAVAAATGFDAGLWGGDRDHDTAAEPPPATAEVTRQTLIDTQTEFGELGYGDPTTVPARLGGTVTALPAVGTVVERGQAIHRVDDTPVVLLYGALPTYRTFAPNAEGADVEQLEANLAALGYTGFTVDKRYTASTAAAVEDWQRDIGVPRTGSVEPGRVLYAAGPVRVDSHRVAVGDAVGPGTSVLEHTGTSRIITVELDVADRRPAVKGAAVTAGLPDGREVAGTIATAETVVAEGDGGEGGKGEPRTKIEVAVTVADQEALAGLDQVSVRVGFTASKREDVLTVPVNALLALAEGGYGVEVANEVLVSRPSDALAARKATERAFTGLLLGLGAVALLVGGVGVANTMVISVLERRAEIGLRRALGATRGQIRVQFLAESLLLSAIGGHPVGDRAPSRHCRWELID